MVFLQALLSAPAETLDFLSSVKINTSGIRRKWNKVQLSGSTPLRASALSPVRAEKMFSAFFRDPEQRLPQFGRGAGG